MPDVTGSNFADAGSGDAAGPAEMKFDEWPDDMGFESRMGVGGNFVDGSGGINIEDDMAKAIALSMQDVVQEDVATDATGLHEQPGLLLGAGGQRR